MPRMYWNEPTIFEVKELSKRYEYVPGRLFSIQLVPRSASTV